MRIEFDGSQEMFKKIIALYENDKSLEVFCVECAEQLSFVKRERLMPILECKKCEDVWELVAADKSKRERVWDKFEKWEQDKDSK